MRVEPRRRLLVAAAARRRERRQEQVGADVDVLELVHERLHVCDPVLQHLDGGGVLGVHVEGGAEEVAVLDDLDAPRVEAVGQHLRPRHRRAHAVDVDLPLAVVRHHKLARQALHGEVVQVHGLDAHARLVRLARKHAHHLLVDAVARLVLVRRLLHVSPAQAQIRQRHPHAPLGVVPEAVAARVVQVHGRRLDHVCGLGRQRLMRDVAKVAALAAPVDDVEAPPASRHDVRHHVRAEGRRERGLARQVAHLHQQQRFVRARVPRQQCSVAVEEDKVQAIEARHGNRVVVRGFRGVYEVVELAHGARLKLGVTALRAQERILDNVNKLLEVVVSRVALMGVD
mmetsp:Transcript_20690/g.73076  ORF Transcript_20690/g.73076 Transcript_20690/m.73076 type:complete len:342 (+) Transcript_20690:956-1981(+)